MCETKRGIGRDRARAGEDGADAVRRHPDVLGEPVRRDPERLQPFLAQERSGRQRLGRLRVGIDDIGQVDFAGIDTLSNYGHRAEA